MMPHKFVEFRTDGANGLLAAVAWNVTFILSLVSPLKRSDNIFYFLMFSFLNVGNFHLLCISNLSLVILF